MKNSYRGWEIKYNPNSPITGKYTAIRHGVELCAANRATIERMVDNKIKEQTNR